MITLTKDQTEAYAALRRASESFHDIQNLRIRIGNRMGVGMVDPNDIGNVIEHDEYGLSFVKDKIEVVEKIVGKEMVRCLKDAATPALVSWMEESEGIGEHTLARLIGQIGHPVIATPKSYRENERVATKKSRVEEHREKKDRKRVLIEGQPYERTLHQLWSYCGLGDPNRSRAKGMTQTEMLALGKTPAKSILWNMVQSCVKVNRGLYRSLYDQERELYADAVHSKECIRCGPSGRPAKEGSLLSKGHQQGIAYRKVSKEILRAVWVHSH